MHPTPPAVSAIRTARLAGVLHVVTLPLGYFSLVYVPRMLAQGAATSTPTTAEWLLRAGVVADIVGQLFFATAVLLLFDLLRPIGPRLARLMLMFALLGVPVACLDEVPQLAAAQTLSSSAALATVTSSAGDQVRALLILRTNGLQIAEIFWGLWLLPLAVLVFRSGFLPRLLAPLLATAAIAYLLDWTVGLLRPDITLPVHALFSLEITLPLWLLLRGVNRQQWEARVGAFKPPH